MISLAAFAGQAIQLRFLFNSGDTASNGLIGWFVAAVWVSGPPSCSVMPPTVFVDGFESGDTSAWSSTFP